MRWEQKSRAFLHDAKSPSQWCTEFLDHFLVHPFRAGSRLFQRPRTAPSCPRVLDVTRLVHVGQNSDLALSKRDRYAPRIFQRKMFRQIHLPQTRSTMRFLVVVATILAALWQTDALGTLSCRLMAYSVGCSPATVAHVAARGCSVSVHRRILTRFSLSAPLLLSPLRIHSRMLCS